MAESRAKITAKLARIMVSSNTYSNTLAASTTLAANTVINGSLTIGTRAIMSQDTGSTWNTISLKNTAKDNEVAIRMYGNTNVWQGTLYASSNSDIGFLNSAAGWSLRHTTANNTLSVANTLLNTTKYAAGTATVAPVYLSAGTTLTTPVAGAFEYDGNQLMFTPSGTGRGIVPSAQQYRLATDLARTDQIAAQSILGQSVAVTTGEYAFEGVFALTKTAGVTSGYLNFLFGGTAVGTISYELQSRFGATLIALEPDDQMAFYSGTAKDTAIACYAASTTAAVGVLIRISGHFLCTTAGTLIPSKSQSAVLGGAHTTSTGSFFRIWPVKNVGTWAAA